MLDGRYPSQEFAELRPRIVWDRVGGTIRARKGARQLAVTNAGTIPDRGLFSVVLPDGRRVGELDEEMVYEARPGQTFLLGASTWRIEDIGRDRVTVTPAPGAPGAVPFWRGDSVGPPAPPRRGDRRIQPLGGRPAGRGARARGRPRRAGREEPARLPARAAGGHARRAQRPHDRRRALPRRDRRLAAVRAVALRRPRPRGLGAGAERPDPRRVRPGVRRDLVRRRDHRPPARRRRAAGRRARAGGARRARGRRRRRARLERAVRRALPRERRPRAADPPRLPRQAHAAVAAAPEVAVAAGGGQALRRLPGDPRDLPRVPARRPRPAGPAGAADQAAPPRAVAGGGRDADRLAVRLVAALRLRRDVHVRGRHAQRRAPRRGAVARPRPAARAARPGRAARADRPRRARAGRGRPAAPLRPHAGRLGRRAGRRPAPRGRPHAEAEAADRVLPGLDAAGHARRRSIASAARSRCASAASSAGSPPTTPASTATPSAPCRPAACPRPSWPTSRAPLEQPARPLRAHARAVHDRRGARALRRRSVERAWRPGARGRPRAR